MSYTLDQISHPGAQFHGSITALRPIDEQLLIPLQEAGRRIQALEKDVIDLRTRTAGLSRIGSGW